MSLAEDMPREPAMRVASVVKPVVLEDIPPQIVLALMETLFEVFAERQFFAPAGIFPLVGPTDWPLRPDAARQYRYGPGFLKRQLPSGLR